MSNTTPNAIKLIVERLAYDAFRRGVEEPDTIAYEINKLRDRALTAIDQYLERKAIEAIIRPEGGKPKQSAKIAHFTKQELREDIECEVENIILVWLSSVRGVQVDRLSEDTYELLRMLAGMTERRIEDTVKSEVNKVLDELQRQADTCLDKQHGTSVRKDGLAYITQYVPLSAIEQVRKEWS